MKRKDRRSSSLKIGSKRFHKSLNEIFSIFRASNEKKMEKKIVKKEKKKKNEKKGPKFLVAHSFRITPELSIGRAGVCAHRGNGNLSRSAACRRRV